MVEVGGVVEGDVVGVELVSWVLVWVDVDAGGVVDVDESSAAFVDWSAEASLGESVEASGPSERRSLLSCLLMPACSSPSQATPVTAVTESAAINRWISRVECIVASNR